MPEPTRPLPADRAFVLQLQAGAAECAIGHAGRVEHLTSGQAARLDLAELLPILLLHLVLACGGEGGDRGQRVATWERGGAAAPAAADAGEADMSDRPVRQAHLEHLKSLDYLGGSEDGAAGDPWAGHASAGRASAGRASAGRVANSPQAERNPYPYPAGAATNSPKAERNLAAIHFQAGRHREAVEIYHRLSHADPGDASLQISLAGALGALGRYDQALAELTRAIELEPLNVEAYHHRAVIFERRGAASPERRPVVRDLSIGVIEGACLASDRRGLCPK